MIKDFLHFNSMCPICGNKLTLFMQVIDSVLLKATQLDKEYIFYPYKYKNSFDESEDTVSLYEIDNSIEINFATTKLNVNINDNGFFLFYLCNENSFEDIGNSTYELLSYDACYYRSSPMLISNPNNNTLEYINANEMNFPNINEHFVVKKVLSDRESIYFISMIYLEDKTCMKYYHVLNKDLNNESFYPNIFEKDLPLLPNKLPFDDRDKLIDKLDSWILMS